MTAYQFNTSLIAGKALESELDDYFSEWYSIIPVPVEFEKEYGIDRIFTSRLTGMSFGVEYKSDNHATGNVFIETVSVDTTGKLGWAYSCRADVLCYYLRQYQIVVAVYPHVIREHLTGWLKHYRHVSVDNGNYNTRGLLVPKDELIRCSLKVMRIHLQGTT